MVTIIIIHYIYMALFWTLKLEFCFCKHLLQGALFTQQLTVTALV